MSWGRTCLTGNVIWDDMCYTKMSYRRHLLQENMSHKKTCYRMTCPTGEYIIHKDTRTCLME